MEWLYIAGFFDGEGCVYIYKGKYGLSVRPQISQKPIKVLEIIKDFLAQKDIHSMIVKYKSGVHSLRINKSAEVYEFLKALYPHLIVKKEITGKALKILEDNKKNKRRYGLKDSTLKEMKMLREWGYTAKQISEETGVKLQTVKSYFYPQRKGQIRKIDKIKWL